jgi:hypothetical protein
MYSGADFGIKVFGPIQISPSATLLTASLSFPLQVLEGHSSRISVALILTVELSTFPKRSILIVAWEQIGRPLTSAGVRMSCLFCLSPLLVSTAIAPRIAATQSGGEVLCK